LELVYDKTAYATLTSEGVDHRLARHIAHLWSRDPLVIYEEGLDQDDEKSSDHFENIQSTNWQTVRFKPPPPGSSIGWRVEFRSMEVMLTDFENAAFTVFIALLSRAILKFGLNLYIPLSKVDANMQRAHKRNAVNTQKFYFRRIIRSCGGESKSGPVDSEYEELTMKEIMCGKAPHFPGLIPLVKTYLDVIECDAVTREVVERYLQLIQGRATGALATTATWLREYVRVHPSYKQDSVLPQDAVYDMAETCAQISRGQIEVPQLLGRLCNVLKSKKATPASDVDGDRGAELSSAHISLCLPGAKGCATFRDFLMKHLHEAASSDQ